MRSKLIPEYFRWSKYEIESSLASRRSGAVPGSLLALLFRAGAAVDAAAEGAGRLHQEQLHQARGDDRDARRHQALHLYLRAQGYISEVSDPARPHALHGRAIWRGQVQEPDRAERAVRARGLHLRLPGRARALHERG